MEVRFLKNNFLKMVRGMEKAKPVVTEESKPNLPMEVIITTRSLSMHMINQVIPLTTTTQKNLFTRRKLYQWR